VDSDSILIDESVSTSARTEWIHPVVAATADIYSNLDGVGCGGVCDERQLLPTTFSRELPALSRVAINDIEFHSKSGGSVHHCVDSD